MFMNSRSLTPSLLVMVIGLSASLAYASGVEREFNAQGVSLSTFLAEAYPTTIFSIEPPLDTIAIAGVYKGERASIIERLADEHGFEHSETDETVQLRIPKHPDGSTPLHLQAWSTTLTQFASQLSEMTTYSFDIDTSINSAISGKYSGSIDDILDTLSFQHEFLIDIDSESASILSADRAASNIISLPKGFAESDEYPEPEDTFYRFGNSFQLSEDSTSATISGHPRFVSKKALDIYIAIAEFKPIEAQEKLQQKPSPTVLPIIEPVAAKPPSVTPKSIAKKTTKKTTKPTTPKEKDFYSDLERIPGFY